MNTKKQLEILYAEAVDEAKLRGPQGEGGDAQRESIALRLRIVQLLDGMIRQDKVDRYHEEARAASVGTQNLYQEPGDMN